MNGLSFRVNAIPVAQPRQRHSRAGFNYIPKGHPIHDFKASVRKAATQAYEGAPLESPLAIHIVCVLPRPKAMCWKKKPTPRVPHASVPDCDNLAKSIQDALNGLIFRDDSQLSRLAVEKWIAAGDEQPHVEVTITPVLNGGEA